MSTEITPGEITLGRGPKSLKIMHIPSLAAVSAPWLGPAPDPPPTALSQSQQLTPYDLRDIIHVAMSEYTSMLIMRRRGRGTNSVQTDLLHIPIRLVSSNTLDLVTS